MEDGSDQAVPQQGRTGRACWCCHRRKIAAAVLVAFHATAIPSACGPCSFARIFLLSLQQECGLRLLPLPKPALLPRQGQGRHVVSAARKGAAHQAHSTSVVRGHQPASAQPSSPFGWPAARLRLMAFPLSACRYDPVFQVKTIDGRTVWRRRHYRVKRDRVPGTFRFSVGSSRFVSLGSAASWLLWPRMRARHDPVLVEPIVVLKPSTVCKPSAERGVLVSGPASLIHRLWHCLWLCLCAHPQVLDNGVTSSEFWRILDCDEGLDW